MSAREKDIRLARRVSNGMVIKKKKLGAAKLICFLRRPRKETKEEKTK